MTNGNPNPFRIPVSTTGAPSDPESLFRDLRNRKPEIQHLWSHQADLIRNYFQHHIGSPDVALELPTGAGKTLVGLLLGEFRRQAKGERVAYLCPTRQLANQVAERAAEYGIPVSLLIGRQADYKQADFYGFMNAQSIAVTTYSAIFNTHPRISDSQVLVMDDAHAAENYVASLWTFGVSRREQPECFTSLVRLWTQGLPAELVDVLEQGEHPFGHRYMVHVVPYATYLDRMDEMRQMLDEMQRTEQLGDAAYGWSVVRGHLAACQAFVSPDSIALRPIIPPASTHSPFAGAAQRIYMSATLGSSGDLERIFGRRKIERLAMPSGWDRQGSGRRLVLFPDVSLSEDKVWDLISWCVGKLGRGLVLCPDYSTSQAFQKEIKSRLNTTILGAQDIEQSLSAFTEQESALLVLASRYDGIDLPGEDCRLLIVFGSPTGVNAQERFLSERLGAITLLTDRIRTRITQATGRCTRGSTDYALVLLVGPGIADFCSKREVLHGFHPELQAEIRFGIDNSISSTNEQAYRAMITEFIAQSINWSEAEKALIKMRDEVQIEPSKKEGVLMACVSDEVDYVECMWGSAYESALRDARKVADVLEGNELAPYRAWWRYLSGVAAWALSRIDRQERYTAIAQDEWSKACMTNHTITWLRDLRRSAEMASAKLVDAEWSDVDVKVSEQVSDALGSLGFSGSKFETYVQSTLELLSQDEARPFEQGLQRLGKLLGFDSPALTENADPDAVWTVYPDFRIVIEAKSNESDTGGVAISSIREATGHASWRSGANAVQPNDILVVLMGHRTKLEEDARRFADNVFYITITEARDLALRCIDALRSVRATSAQSDPSVLKENILITYGKYGLLPTQLRDLLYSKPLSSLPSTGK